jgi:hypothetical protein
LFAESEDCEWKIHDIPHVQGERVHLFYDSGKTVPNKIKLALPPYRAACANDHSFALPAEVWKKNFLPYSFIRQNGD